MYGEIGKGDFFENDAGSKKFSADLGIDHETLRAAYRSAPWDLVTKLRGKCRGQGKIFGCKVFYCHVDANPWISDFLLAPETRVIHLYRNRVFDTFTSLMLARTTGIWHSSQYPDVKLKFDEAAYQEYRESVRTNFRRWSRLLASEKTPEEVLEIEYSAIGSGVAVELIAPFLGFEDLGFPSLEKQSKHDAISYWDESDNVGEFTNDRVLVA